MNNAIVLVFDDAYAAYAIACLNSIYANYPNHPDILAYYPGTDPAVLSVLQRLKARQIRETPAIRSAFASARLGPVGKPTIYDRFVIWTDALQDYERILYLDADTLILRPLDELFSKERFFAVANHEPTNYVRIFHPDQYTNPVLLHHLHDDGLDLPVDMDTMINAGVLLAPKSYRSQRHLALLIELTERYGTLLNYADQSLLSLWCLKLGITPSTDYRYNFQSPFFGDPEIKIAFEDIYILHFSSERKPLMAEFHNWNRLGRFAKKCEEIYLDYASL